MLNFALMRHWENWLIVLFVVLLAFTALNIVAKKLTPKMEGNN